MRTVAIMICLLALCACAATQAIEKRPMGELARGNHSHQMDQRFLWVTSQQALLQVWRELDGSMPPRIDFDGNAVVAVFMGQQSSGGHSIVVEQVVLEGGRLVIDVLMRLPGEGCYTTQALTKPYHLVVTPAHEGDVEFRERSVRVSCQ